MIIPNINLSLMTREHLCITAKAEIRRHLNDFFPQDRVHKLLILYEITNNVDLETKNHIAEVLQNYPATMILVFHDQTFGVSLGLATKML